MERQYHTTVTGWYGETTLEWFSGDADSSPDFATNLTVTLDKSLNLSEPSYQCENFDAMIFKVP